MPAEQTFLFDRIEGIEEDPPQLTVSGEDKRIYRECTECGKTNGRHAYHCSFNHDFWDDVEALLEYPPTREDYASS